MELKSVNSNTPSPSAAERTISHDEAREAALALIDHWFQNANGRRVQTRIPVDPTDTDVVLTDYIEQQRNAEAELSRIRTLLSDRDRLALELFNLERGEYAGLIDIAEWNEIVDKSRERWRRRADKLKTYLLGGGEE